MNDAALEAAAAWWAQQLQVRQKRAEFGRELLHLLKKEWEKAEEEARLDPTWKPFVRLNVDYDPEGLLLDAIRNVGINCRGCMGSADGLFDRKTRSDVGAGFFSVREGYGAFWRDVFGKGRGAAERDMLETCRGEKP
jgi:hypothetical protein